MQHITVIINVIIVQLHCPENPVFHVEYWPTNFVCPVNHQTNWAIPDQFGISHDLIIEEPRQFIEISKLVVLSLVIEEVVSINYLIPLILLVFQLNSDRAIWTEVVFSCNVAIPVVNLFNRDESTIIVPTNLQQLAKVIKVLKVNDVLFLIIASPDIHNPVTVPIVVIVDSVSFTFPARIDIKILNGDIFLWKDSCFLEIIK